jgi:hypothetical protein
MLVLSKKNIPTTEINLFAFLIYAAVEKAVWT